MTISEQILEKSKVFFGVGDEEDDWIVPLDVAKDAVRVAELEFEIMQFGSKKDIDELELLKSKYGIK